MHFRVFAPLVLAGVCAVMLALPGAALAEVGCTVTNARTAHTSKTLGEAVEAAKAGDTLKVQGVCRGDSTVTKSLTIEGISSSKTGPATLDGEGEKGSVLAIEAAKIVKLTGLTITDGGYTFAGAGVYASSALTVESDTFKSNVANRGGAIFSSGAPLHVVKSTFTENEAYDFGAAIESYRGSLSVSASRFTHDQAGEGGAIFAVSEPIAVASSSFEEDSAGEGHHGGAIATRYATATITESTFKHNHATDAGAIGVEEGKLSIASSTIEENEATTFGGGLYLEHCQFTISDSSISHNGAEVGGGAFYDEDVQATISDSKLEDNTLGAIRAIDGSLTIVSSDFTNNSAGVGDGGAVSDTEGSLEARASTFSGNKASDGGALDLVGLAEGDGLSAQLTDTVLKQNSAEASGGAIATYQVPLELSGSSLQGNHAHEGGGLFDQGGLVAAEGSRLEANTAVYGGGLYTSSTSEYTGDVALEHSTVAKNIAEQDGGGAYIESGELEVDYSTITLNQAGREGGGIFNALGTLALEHATITSNKPQNCEPSGMGC